MDAPAPSKVREAEQRVKETEQVAEKASEVAKKSTGTDKWQAERDAATARRKAKEAEYELQLIKKEAEREAAERAKREEAERAKRETAENPLTADKYNKIKMGMTYDQVVKIIGVEGNEVSRVSGYGHTIAMVQWQNRGLFQMGTNMVLTFEGEAGELLRVTGKGQFGLH
jgi:hypothetical protein